MERATFEEGLQAPSHPDGSLDVAYVRGCKEGRLSHAPATALVRAVEFRGSERGVQFQRPRCDH